MNIDLTFTLSAAEDRPPPLSTQARVVHAVVIPSDNTSPVKMHWRCTCGGGGQNYPGEQTRCAYCRWPVTIPTEPLDAPPADEAASGGELTFVRDENIECALPPRTRRFLVARWPDGLTKVREVFLNQAEQ